MSVGCARILTFIARLIYKVNVLNLNINNNYTFISNKLKIALFRQVYIFRGNAQGPSNIRVS